MNNSNYNIKEENNCDREKDRLLLFSPIWKGENNKKIVYESGQGCLTLNNSRYCSENSEKGYNCNK